MPTHTIRLHRVLRATPELVYRAFLAPAALAKWFPPSGFIATVHELDDTVGGAYRITFTGFASGHGHSFGGSFLELAPYERIRYSGEFEDPELLGEMHTTVSLRAVASGTELEIVQEGVPALIPLDACYLGWQESLAQLAQLVEAEVRE